MKVVIDTNVLVSGFLSPFGPPASILRSILRGSLTLCFDERILAEYRDTLTQGRLRLDPVQVGTVLEFIEINGIRTLPEALDTVLPDPDDAMFVEVAKAADAPIVTGNQRHFPSERLQGAGVSVLTPRAFVDMRRTEGPCP